MKQEKRFLIPEAIIVELFNADIITTSDIDDNDDTDLPPYPNEWL